MFTSLLVVARPLPWQVRLHGRSKTSIKLYFFVGFLGGKMARGMVYYFARLFPLLCVSGLASVSLYLSPSLSSLLDGLPNKHPSPPRLTGNKNAGIKIVLPELDHLRYNTSMPSTLRFHLTLFSQILKTKT